MTLHETELTVSFFHICSSSQDIKHSNKLLVLTTTQKNHSILMIDSSPNKLLDSGLCTIFKTQLSILSWLVNAFEFILS